MVLLHWKRTDNVRLIVDRVVRLPFVGEVIVWDNAGGFELKQLSAGYEKIKVVHSKDGNKVTWGRFLAAKMATYRIIATQDDDYLVLNWESLWKRFLTHRARITHSLDKGHYLNEAGRRDFAQLGWGSLWLRDWVSVFDPWLAKYGEDEMLRRKADRVFGALFGGRDRFDPVEADVQELHGARGPEALYKLKDHGRLTKEAVLRARELVGSGGNGNGNG